MSLTRFRSANGLPVVVSETTPLPVAVAGESIQVNANVNIPTTINAVITNPNPIAVVGPNNGDGQLGVVRLATAQVPLPIRLDGVNTNDALRVIINNTPVPVTVSGTVNVDANVANTPLPVTLGDQIVYTHVMGFTTGAQMRTVPILMEGTYWAEWVTDAVALPNTNEVAIENFVVTPSFGDMVVYTTWTVHALVTNLPANATLTIRVDGRRNWGATQGAWQNLTEAVWSGEPFTFEARHYHNYRFRVQASQVGAPNPQVRLALIGTVFPQAVS